MSKILTPKTSAPDFTLSVTADQKLSLSELKGQPVILAFYPADWKTCSAWPYKRKFFSCLQIHIRSNAR